MSDSIKYNQQIDALRAIAALGVIIYHFYHDFKIGSVGVDVFFTISGYLITAILIKQKIANGSKILVVRNFIIRRSLRLFPAYYLLITFFGAMMWAFDLYVWNNGEGIFYYTYTQNILFFIDGMRGVQLNHVWTLAVEEQFYLLWPWLLLFVNTKQIMRGLIIIIPLALIFKSITDIVDYRMLMTAHLDTLGIGALLALWLVSNKTTIPNAINRYKVPLIVFSLALLIYGLFFNHNQSIISISIFLLCSSLIVGCVYGWQGYFGKLLNLSLLHYLGRISYGLYLYHLPVKFVLTQFLRKTDIAINYALFFAIGLALTIAISHLSFRIIEQPFLSLKSRFDFK